MRPSKHLPLQGMTHFCRFQAVVGCVTYPVLLKSPNNTYTHENLQPLLLMSVENNTVFTAACAQLCWL